MEHVTVSALVKLLGINDNTLRCWERRYQAVSPKRDAQGSRLYSSADVERVKLLWSLVKEGHGIGRIAVLSNARLKKMLLSTISPAVFRSGGDVEPFLHLPGPSFDGTVLVAVV